MLRMPIANVSSAPARQNARFATRWLPLLGAALFLFLLCSPAQAARRLDFSSYAEGTFLRIRPSEVVTVVSTAQLDMEAEIQRQKEAGETAKRQAAYQKGLTTQDLVDREAKEKRDYVIWVSLTLLLTIAVMFTPRLVTSIPDSWIGGKGKLRDSLAAVVAFVFSLGIWIAMIVPLTLLDSATKWIIFVPIALVCFALIAVTPVIFRIVVGPVRSRSNTILFSLASLIVWNTLFVSNSPFFFVAMIPLLAFYFVMFDVGKFLWGGEESLGWESLLPLLPYAILFIAASISIYFLYRAILTWGDD